jgi:hypothetical protein
VPVMQDFTIILLPLKLVNPVITLYVELAKILPLHVLKNVIMIVLLAILQGLALAVLQGNI